MNNYKKQNERTFEQGYTTISYPHEGGITFFDILCQTHDRPSCTEDSKLVVAIKE